MDAHQEVDNDAETKEKYGGEEEKEGKKEPSIAIKRKAEKKLPIDGPGKGKHAEHSRGDREIAE